MLGFSKVKHFRFHGVKHFLVAVFVVQFCSNLQAQDVATKFGGSISDVPIISTRANAMSGAVAGFADRYDALYYNPAGIAGNLYYGENNKEPFVRQVIIPRVGLTVNENSQDLHSEFSANGAVNNSTKGSSLIKSHEGNHQYARFSFTPVGLFFGNMALVPIVDQQISAVPQNTEEGDIQFQYRSLNGVLVGSALHDPKGVLSVGVSTFLGTLQDTKGTAPYKELVDVKAREEIMSQNQNTYSAKSMNIGVKMKIPKKLNPSISIVARNAGNPVYESTKSGKDSLTMKEDLTAAMAIAPSIGKIGRFHLGIEGSHLSQKSMAASEKYRAGMEATFGDSEDSKAFFAVRAGYAKAGASGGAQINIGLIGLEAATHMASTHSNQASEANYERRSTYTIYIDAASF